MPHVLIYIARCSSTRVAEIDSSSNTGTAGGKEIGLGLEVTEGGCTRTLAMEEHIFGRSSYVVSTLSA